MATHRRARRSYSRRQLLANAVIAASRGCHPMNTAGVIDFDAAFRAIAQDGSHMVLVLSGPTFGIQRAHIADLAMQHRLPTMFTFRHYVEAGGLMSYGIDTVPIFRRAASFVAKILRGAKPSDLPVEQPTNTAAFGTFAT